MARPRVVATDNYAGGQLAGTWLAENLPEGATLAVLQGVLGNPSLDDRVTGMLDTLGDAAEVVATTPTDCDQTKGLDAGQDILTANPGLTAIYAACGPPLLGAIEAIKSAGLEGLITVGFDASPDEVAAILAGTQTASVAQFPAKMGSLGVQAAFDAASGQGRRAAHRHRHRDGDDRQRGRLPVGRTSPRPSRRSRPRRGGRAFPHNDRPRTRPGPGPFNARKLSVDRAPYERLSLRQLAGFTPREAPTDLSARS